MNSEMALFKNRMLRLKYWGLFLIPMVLLISLVMHRHPLQFSHEPGFYNGGFFLEIEGDPFYDIYYTIDGSNPSLDSICYSGPIRLDNASVQENRYASSTAVSTGFRTDLINQFSYNDPHYAVPDYKVDKCHVIRAAMFNKDGTKVSEIIGSFVVGLDEQSKYDNMKIVSIITDPDNLFDSKNGIYVTGEAFKDYKLNFSLPEEERPERLKYWWWWTGNYSLSGIVSEREAYVEVFDELGSTILSDYCGIRIQGGGSRGQLPKSLGIYSRNEYSGQEEFSSKMFSLNRNVHKFVVFSGGDDCKFKLKDYMVSSLSSRLSFSTMEFQPCMLFLNGEFWGAHYIVENYNADYIHDHYGVGEENIIMVKNGELHEGIVGEIETYYDLYAFLIENDMSLDMNYMNAKTMMDMDSFTEFHAIRAYLAGIADWPAGNLAAWRSRDVRTTNPYEDGRWRWMLFDVNSGAPYIEHLDYDTLAKLLAQDKMFASLAENDEFKALFVSKLQLIGEDIFAPEKCSAFIDQYLDLMLEPICASNLRFYGDEYREETIQNAEGTRKFFNERYQYVREHIALNLGQEYIQ